MINIDNIRTEFPILNRQVNGKPLVYLDNAATTQKPKMVIDAIAEYYGSINANVHRGIHTLSQLATDEMEKSRRKIQKFINAKHEREVIFTQGTTDGINLLSYALRDLLSDQDEIIISEIDHHSNIVPWQLLSEMTGAKLKYIPLTEEASLDMSAFDKMLSPQTKIVAVNHISNALGVINPIEEIISKAHSQGAWVMIDGAQAVPHIAVDVQALDADFYVFSGHKMYAPTGTGVFYGKEEILEQLSPYRGGGEMIATVNMQQSTYAELPFKFEAGTPNICGNIVLGTAVDFMQQIGSEAIARHEHQLINYAMQKLQAIEELEIYAPSVSHSGAISFNMKQTGVHSSDVGMILDKMGIAVRTGQHCCQPIMDKLQVPGTVRASFAVYNNLADIDALSEGLKLAVKMLG